MLRRARRSWPAWREAADQRAPVTSLNRGRIGLDRRLALGAAVMSYAGQLNLTAVADRDYCPDVEVFADGVRRALDDLAQQPA
jgi:hypothetical protein